MNGEMMLVFLIVVGLIGRSHIIATAASFLLILKLTSLERYFPTVERRGLELGLLFLTMAVLVPFASEKVTLKDVWPLLTSVSGIIAIAGGAVATYMNAKGLSLLKVEPQMIIALVVGSILGVVFMRGIPVGPLMAAGITYIFLKMTEWIFKP